MSIVRESLLHMDTNDKREDAADSSPFRGFEVPEDVVVDINNDQGEDEGASKDNTVEIDEMNSYFLMRMRIYEKILSPQLEKNEKLKRKHKADVVQKLFTIRKWQFIATYVFTLVMILMIALSNWLKIEQAVLEDMFSFLKFYITSILAELIAILFFIVKQVFDSSIVELFKNFDRDLKK